MSETSERPWAIEGLTIMDRCRSRIICFFGDSDQDRADAELVIEAVNGREAAVDAVDERSKCEAAEAELASVREERDTAVFRVRAYEEHYENCPHYARVAQLEAALREIIEFQDHDQFAARWSAIDDARALLASQPLPEEKPTKEKQ